MTPERNDPEMSYRRGYQQGAQELFNVIEGALPPECRQIVKPWIGLDLAQWRVAAMRGESGRGTAGITAGEYAPTWRLGNLSHQNSN